MYFSNSLQQVWFVCKHVEIYWAKQKKHQSSFQCSFLTHKIWQTRKTCSRKALPKNRPQYFKTKLKNNETISSFTFLNAWEKLYTNKSGSLLMNNKNNALQNSQILSKWFIKNTHLNMEISTTLKYNGMFKLHITVSCFVILHSCYIFRNSLLLNKLNNGIVL